MSRRRRTSASTKDSQPLLLPSQRARQQQASQKSEGGKAMPKPCPTGTGKAARQAAFSQQESGDGKQSQPLQPPTDDTRPHTNHADAATVSGVASLPLGQGVRLVAHHPCGLYVLDKPEGILSHPNKRTEINRSLLTAPYSLQEECFYDLHAPADKATQQPTAAHNSDAAPPRRLYLLHRLDSATSGLLLLADNQALANSVRAAFAANSVHKTYLALCISTQAPMPAQQKGRWSNRLQREHSGAGGSVVHVRVSGSGSSATTDFNCLKTAPRNRRIALLQLRPISGRTHQLRVHCAQHHLPIIGDGKYGDFRLNRTVAKETGYKRLFLHAAELEFDFTFEGKTLHMQFASPLPPEFDVLLNNPPVLAPTRSPEQRGTLRQRRSKGR